MSSKNVLTSVTRVQANTLLTLARGAIDEALQGPASPLPDDGWLFRKGASFVTLRQDSELRGCIGSLEAVHGIGEDVRRNAVAAAMRDPRFSPMTRNELRDTRIELTLLSEVTPLEPAETEDEALKRVRPDVDGLILSWGGRRATFIPQMWEQLPEPKVFLGYLKRKAGLPSDFWHPSVRLQRFTAEKWEERGAPAR